MARLVLADRCSLKQQKAPVRGFFYGRYWARTSDPQLVETWQVFAPVHTRSVIRLVTGVALRRTEPVRTRANASCSQCSHRAAITPTRLRRQYARARWRLDAALARRRTLRTQIADVRCRVAAARGRRVARRAALRRRSFASRRGRTRTSRARGSRRRCSSRPTRATVAGSPRR